ncbi:Uncharacterized protein GBIM_14191 [Gryllus bimaculatus]|nr:Uncharacterized protein GBIM_14191 [Gryllus bimaculatus]
MGLKAAIQALKKAEKLKEKVQNSKDLLNDNDAWLCQQQLQRIYQQVLILDLEYALDRKVEQELWNHGFKNYIGTLQNLAKDKKNPKRPESQAMLSWCLEAASGFYLTLLQEICTAFDLDLPFRRKGSVFGSGKILRAVEHLSQPHKSSCYYICQHCLVHLGDIARYRNQSRQAEAFYRHAVQLAPHSGQPYNQLALLEASRGDRLSTVFHYVRSVEVRHPFPAAATNLARTLTKSGEEQLNVEGRNKLSTSEYISVFLKLHGILYAGTDLNLAEKYVKILTTTLTAHVATESLTSWKFVQMLAVNLFALHHAGGALQNDKSFLAVPDEQLTKEESQSRHLILDIMAGSLSALLLPVYTLKEGEALLEYFALPAIKLTLDWIRLEPKVLLDTAFTTRLQIWPSLCKLLNGLQSSVVDLPEKYYSVPLPEDRDLQGFLPLEKVFNGLRFNNQDWNLDAAFMNKLRAFRLVEFGKWLTKQDSYQLIISRLNNNSSIFEAVGGLQVPPSDLIRELEELSLTKLPSPAPSEASSWGSSVTGTSTPDNGLVIVPSLPSPHSPPLQSSHFAREEPKRQRRSGILKPQGSLEKSREKENLSDISSWNVVGNSVPKRGRQNVALQAIMRKSVLSGENVETSRNLESKQVTFKTPSPSNSPNSLQGADEIAVRKTSKTNAWQHQVPQQPVAVAATATLTAAATTALKPAPQPQQVQPTMKPPLPQTAPQCPPAAQMPLQPVPPVPQSALQHNLQVLQQPLLPATSLPQNHLQMPQQPLAFKHSTAATPPQAQARPVVSFVAKEPPQLSGMFTGFNGSSQLPLYPNQPLPGGQNNLFPPQQQQQQQQQQQSQSQKQVQSQQQQQQHLYGLKMHQPSYTWQEESTPAPPASAWWGTDQQPVANSREDSNQSQPLASSALNLGFYNNLLQQQQQSLRGLNHLKSDNSNEIFSNNTWNGLQMSAPISVNLHHQLVGGLHRNQFASPAASQNLSHLAGTTGFQAPPLTRTDMLPNHLSVFTSSGSMDADLSKKSAPDSIQSDAPSVQSSENTMFSSAPVTGSFSSLGSLGANTYSLFSTSNWTANNMPRTVDMENGSRNGLNGVLGVSGGSSLGLGQQSLWSGPGPSPLERLLEQQKQLREGPTPKGGT